MAYQLLTSNTKLLKGDKRYTTMGVTLSPADSSGLGNVCPMAGFCKRICVAAHTGRSVTQQAKDARYRRTELFFNRRSLFLELLDYELSQFTKQAKRKNKQPLVRLNVGSDIAYEKLSPTIFSNHQDILFYDYTKLDNRFELSNVHPANYFLTYSYSELSQSTFIDSILQRGFNMSVVYDAIYRPQTNTLGPLPSVSFGGVEVIDGDKHDHRLPTIDGRGVVIGLRGKGSHKRIVEAIAGGFILPCAGGHLSHTAA